MTLLNKVKKIVSQFQEKTDYIENSINNLGKNIDENVNKISNYFGQQSIIENIKSNPDLALKLFQTLSVGYSLTPTEQRKIDSILKTCTCRQDILNKVIELCGEPTTPKQRYIYAMAYSWSNKEYRKLAIYYLEKYLGNPLYDDVYRDCHHLLAGKQFSLAEEKNIHLGNMYLELGKVYESEYEFDKALNCYQKGKELTPFWAFPICNIANILIKQNKLSDALLLVIESKNTKYYLPIKFKTELSNKIYVDDTFKKVIDNKLKDIEEKMENGYVYKPRKRK